MEEGTRWCRQIADDVTSSGVTALENLEDWELENLDRYVARQTATGTDYQKLGVEVLKACLKVTHYDREAMKKWRQIAAV